MKKKGILERLKEGPEKPKGYPEGREQQAQEEPHACHRVWFFHKETGTSVATS